MKYVQVTITGYLDDAFEFTSNLIDAQYTLIELERIDYISRIPIAKGKKGVALPLQFKSGKYRTYVTLDGKVHYLGSYLLETQARVIQQIAIRRYVNHPIVPVIY